MVLSEEREGALVALRRLDEALENGDPIYGIIKASAVVQDWHSETLTAPSVQGQVEMLEKALQQSGWGKDDLDYIEAHGSGTPVGDTIELEALHRTFAGRKAVLPVGLRERSPWTFRSCCRGCRPDQSTVNVCLSAHPCNVNPTANSPPR